MGNRPFRAAGRACGDRIGRVIGVQPGESASARWLAGIPILGCLAIAGIIICGCAAENAGKPPEKAQSAPQNTDNLGPPSTTGLLTPEPRGFAALIRHRLAKVRTQDLAALVADSNCSLALAAGWETVLRTTETKDPKEGDGLDESAISRFLGLVEGRLCVEIPEFWEHVFQTAEWRGHGDVVFTSDMEREMKERSQRPRRETPASRPITTLPTSAEDATAAPVRREGDRWIVTQGGRNWTVPADDGTGFAYKAAVLVDKDMTFAVVYGAHFPPVGRRIFALSQDGRIVWTGYVWADGGLLAYSGQHTYDMALRAGGSGITVFGMAGNLAHTEVFDRATGKPTCKFCTLYFDQRFDK
jgi:hypothetical protein